MGLILCEGDETIHGIMYGGWECPLTMVIDDWEHILIDTSGLIAADVRWFLVTFTNMYLHIYLLLIMDIIYIYYSYMHVMNIHIMYIHVHISFDIRHSPIDLLIIFPVLSVSQQIGLQIHVLHRYLIRP